MLLQAAILEVFIVSIPFIYWILLTFFIYFHLFSSRGLAINLGLIYLYLIGSKQGATGYGDPLAQEHTTSGGVSAPINPHGEVWRQSEKTELVQR
jgi:hypothetical protein